jgi:uncharacterized protein (TIGR01777 family)
MRVFVTGATGLVGSRLVRRILARGDSVVALSRRPIPPDHPASAAETVVGDPTFRGPWVEKLAACDAVVHLAGENIFARRWTDAFMAELRASRVHSTALIAAELAKQPAKVLISASAIGYYGPHGDEELTEDAPPGHDFMAKLCVEWEAAADPARAAGVRVVHPRIGIVLDSEGGALPQLARPFKLFVGGRVGSGKQYVSWIHLGDLVELLLFLIDNPAAVGPVNATAPHPVTNAEFGRALAAAVHRPNWLPAPSFALRLALGKVSEVAVAGQRVVPAKGIGLGFRFKFPTLSEALGDLFASKARR